MKRCYFILVLIALGCGQKVSTEITADTLRISDTVATASTKDNPEADIRTIDSPEISVEVKTLKAMVNQQPVMVVEFAEDAVIEDGIVSAGWSDGSRVERYLNFQLVAGGCEGSDMPFSYFDVSSVAAKTIGNIEFKFVGGGDNAMQMYQDQRIYWFEAYGSCFIFTQTCRASTYSDPEQGIEPVAFDEATYVQQFEEFLATIQMN